MKAIASETMQVIFAILLVFAILVFIPSKIAEPSLSAYGNIQARLIARTIATSVDAIAISDSGSFSKTFETVWDIKVDSDRDGSYVEVSHGEFSSGKVRINSGPVPKAKLADSGSILIAKASDGEMKITGD